MLSIEAFRQLALAMPEAEEKEHFGMPSFRVKNKIFATIHVKDNRAMIKLTLVDQSVFCAVDNTAIYPVPGGWGRVGATFFELKNAEKTIVGNALKQAWVRISPKGLGEIL